MMSKVERFELNRKYRVKKDWKKFGLHDDIIVQVKKGELLTYTGKSFYAHFESGQGESWKLILLNTKEAFRLLEEAE